MKGPEEFYNAQEHQLNKRLLSTVRATIAEYVATHPESDGIRYVLEQAGFTVPVLYCQGYTRYDDPCGLKRYHEGECRWT